MRANERENVIFIAAFMVKLEEILEKLPKAFEPAKKELKTARTMAEKALKIAMQDATPADAKAVDNHLKIYDLKLVAPIGCTNDFEHLRVVDKNVLARMLNQVVTDCMLCDKEGKQAHKCRMRQDLIQCGLIGGGDEDNDCEFKTGVCL